MYKVWAKANNSTSTSESDEISPVFLAKSLTNYIDFLVGSIYFISKINFLKKPKLAILPNCGCAFVF